MTPKQAIRLECLYCQNTRTQLSKCLSVNCLLNSQTLTTLQAIKAHCLECVPGKTPREVKKCPGKVLGVGPHTCYLHIYRDGHNPKRKGMGNASALLPKRQLTGRLSNQDEN